MKDTTYIFGHRRPDTDSVAASIALSYLKNTRGYNTTPVILDHLNKETEFVLDYLGLEAPELLESVEDEANVILVDHNSPSESVDNLENANILNLA